MPAKDLGVKHTCYKCGTRFYDLKKPEPLCPKCGADQRESPAVKSPPAAEKRRPPPRAVQPAQDVDVEARPEEDEDEGAGEEEPAEADDD